MGFWAEQREGGKVKSKKGNTSVPAIAAPHL